SYFLHAGIFLLTQYRNQNNVFELILNLNFGLFQDHLSNYHFLALFSKGFLTSSAVSCAVESPFSSAADVCASGCGKLKQRKSEKCVSSNPKIVNTYTAFSGKKEGILNAYQVKFYHLNEQASLGMLKGKIQDTHPPEHNMNHQFHCGCNPNTHLSLYPLSLCGA
ncbi:hypothetical protein VP01_5491g1, partial [Puccinia sorghi]